MTEAGTTTEDGHFSSDLVSKMMLKLEALIRKTADKGTIELTAVFDQVARRIRGQTVFMRGRPEFTIQIDGTVGAVEDF